MLYPLISNVPCHFRIASSSLTLRHSILHLTFSVSSDPCTTPPPRKSSSNKPISLVTRGVESSKQRLPKSRHSIGTIPCDDDAEQNYQSPPRRKRRSSLLSEIQRSARQTFKAVRKALRASNIDRADLSASVSSDARLGEHQQSFDLPEPSKYRMFDNVNYSENQNTLRYPQDGLRFRTVNLIRTDLQQPFGIFVTKSDTGRSHMLG